MRMIQMPELKLMCTKDVEPPERMNTFFPTNIACLFGCSLKVVVLLNSQTHLRFGCFRMPHIFGLGRDGGFLVKIDKRN